MTRPHIEFIQSQALGWVSDALPAHPGVEIKILSEDAETGACSSLIRYPEGYTDSDPHALDADEEVFILSGSLTCDDQQLNLHGYAYWPAGTRRERLTAPDGAVVLTFFDRRPNRIAPESRPVRADAGAVPALDSIAMPWDMANFDAQIEYLKMGRKNLRVPPDGSGRTYLLGSMPQVFPPSGEEPLERHDFVEEAFLISGDLALTVGVMRPGAYFWRPPGLWHGGMASAAGYLMLMRTPGANAARNDWSEERVTVSLDPPYEPILPDALKTRISPPRAPEY